MFFYLFILLYLICIAGRYHICGNSIKKDLKLKISFFILTFIAIFRFNIGGDYANYWNAIWPVLTKEFYRWEIIPRLIGYIAYFVKYPPLFFIIIGIPTYYFFYKGILENSISYYESLIIFFSVFYLDTMLFARSILAASILFWASKFVFNKQLGKYLLVCIICFFIHKTSLIALPIYFIYNYIDWKVSFIGTILVIVFKKFLLSKLGVLGIYSDYFITLGSLQGGNSLKYFYVLIIIFIAVVSISKHDFNIQLKHSLSVLIAGTFFPFVFGGHIGMRLSWFYFIYLCYAWPVALRKFSIKERAIYLCGFYLFFILLLGISIKTHPTNSPYTPYSTIFFIDKNKVFNEKLILKRK